MRNKRGIATSVLVLAALATFLPMATAQESSGESVATTIRIEDDAGERIGAEGVLITVLDAEGNELGSAATDAEGEFFFEVPGPGEYSLLLDETTLPPGWILRNPDRNPAVITLNAGQDGRTIFATTRGDGTGTGTPLVQPDSGVTFRQVAQLTVEGLKLGVFIAMMAIGLSLIFGTTGLVNFAHGEMVGWGMLIAYLFNFYGLAGVFGWLEGLPAPLGSGMNLAIAALFAIIGGAAMGWAFDRFIFGPLRRRGAGLIAQMVVTIGLSLVLRYAFLFAFGGNPRFFRDYTAQRALQLGVIEITPKDLITGLLSVLILVGVGLFLMGTRMGKAMRAVADNRDLAESSGIDVQRVIRFIWTLGGALAALGGVFMGLSEQVSWNIGFRTLLLVFAGVILGGLGTAFGALVGSLLVGIGIQVSTIVVPTELKNVGALVLLITILIFRPQGILGRKERIG